MPITNTSEMTMEGRNAISSLPNLAQVAIGERFVVRSILANGGAPEWQQQLEDIGFIVGEPVTLMAKGAFGGDPLVVRIGLSTFALRKAEAACILVEPESTVMKVAA
ncbi:MULTISPECIES: FeoA family protein [Undibacterium]|nr:MULTISPECIES: FeoA family protein [Undibacterium]